MPRSSKTRVCRFLGFAGTVLLLSLIAPTFVRSESFEEIDEQAFRELDVGGDRRLTGREAQSVLRYDADGNGTVSKAEFFAGRKKDRAAGHVHKSGPSTKKLKDGVPLDPTAEAWDRKLKVQFESGNRWAFMVGIDDYKSQKKTKGPVKNAHLLYEALNQHCGYDASRMVILADDLKDPAYYPTLVNMRKHLSALLKKIEPNDTLIVAFSGHGGLTKGKSLLCPIEFDSSDEAGTGWPTDELRLQLQGCPASQKVLILDCCHSGGATTELQTKPSGVEIGASFEHAQGLLTLAACRKDETSLSTALGVVFTRALVHGLLGHADADHNGIVDSDEIYRYAILEVPIAARELFPDHRQTPVRIIGEDVVGVFALSRPDGPPPKDKGPVRSKAGDRGENSLGMKFICIPTDTFLMGSPEDEFRREGDEPRQQSVTISRLIFIGIHEVTQEQYTAVMGRNPSYYSANGGGSELVEGMKTRQFPVEQVSWNDAIEFCRKLSTLPDEVASFRHYRLPSEAEWEYACRADTTGAFHTGDLISSVQANIRGDRPYLDSPEGPTLGRTTKVGSYFTNAFGLFDMHGNVAEWCQDYYARRPFSSFGFMDKDAIAGLKNIDPEKRKAMASPVNPVGPKNGETRVYRGGGHLGDVAFCRSAARRHNLPTFRHRNIGFRVITETRKPPAP